MQKVLNQEEIDAMVQAARGAAAPAAGGQRVEPWDVRRAGQIGRDQLQAITQLHETFARNLTHSLGAYLRVVFAANLVSAEHIPFREFLQRIPETTYLASCHLLPMDVSAVLQLDLKVAFPIIDLLLGGEGKGLANAREITEIEEQILDSVARIICRELGSAWQSLASEVHFGERMEAAAAGRLMAPEEKTLSLSFEITMPEVRGGLNVAVPGLFSSALLRQISAAWSHQRPRAEDSRRRLMRSLVDCPLTLDLGSSGLRLAVGAFAGLSPGHLVRFSSSVHEPGALSVDGRALFRALPARIGDLRAARILERVPQNPSGLDRRRATGSLDEPPAEVGQL